MHNDIRDEKHQRQMDNTIIGLLWLWKIKEWNQYILQSNEQCSKYYIEEKTIKRKRRERIKGKRGKGGKRKKRERREGEKRVREGKRVLIRPRNGSRKGMI